MPADAGDGGGAADVLLRGPLLSLRLWAWKRTRRPDLEGHRVHALLVLSMCSWRSTSSRTGACTLLLLSRIIALTSPTPSIEKKPRAGDCDATTISAGHCLSKFLVCASNAEDKPGSERRPEVGPQGCPSSAASRWPSHLAPRHRVQEMPEGVHLGHAQPRLRQADARRLPRRGTRWPSARTCRRSGTPCPASRR